MFEYVDSRVLCHLLCLGDCFALLKLEKLSSLGIGGCAISITLR
jgi:hypothetical protein